MKTSTKKTKTFQYLFILFAMTFFVNGFAQDTIITRDGRSIIGHVLEISTTEVKYKKTEIADGPLYIETKSGVRQINYKNGFKDVFPELKPWQIPVTKIEQEEIINIKQKPLLVKRKGKYEYGDKRLGENQLYRLLLSVNDREINNQVKRAKRSRRLQYAGFAAVPFAAFSMFALIVAGDVHTTGTNKEEKDASKAFFGCAVICAGSSLCFIINRKHRNAEAVRLYKQKFE